MGIANYEPNATRAPPTPGHAWPIHPAFLRDFWVLPSTQIQATIIGVDLQKEKILDLGHHYMASNSIYMLSQF